MAMSASSQAFADPAAESRIRRAWEAVLSGAPVPGGGGLRGLIERSWHRCVRARVDPAQFGGPQPLAPAEFERLRALHGDLLLAGAPVLDHAQGVLAGFGCLVTLSDSASVILAAAGEARVLDAGRAIHLMPGVDWSESHCGTNAIGTALAAAGPVQVHSAEHFCEGIKRWTCSAALIRDPAGGGPVGVLDVSGLSDTYSRHNLAFAVMSARHIESRLAALDIERRHRLVEAVRGQWRRAGDALGAILLDGRGFLVSFNAAAQRALARAGADIVLERTHAMPGFAPGEGRGAAGLPPWARPEWVEPVFLDGVRQGTLLLLPAAPARPGATVEEDPLAAVITEDPAVRVLVAQARQLRESDTAVLLVGETGVGKELFARGLHRAGPFVVLNCGGLSRELLASELFGYADGAFTGARKGGMPGKIEAAAGGTLFLDEIGEMPLDMQTYLLRVLEQREVCRLGENAPRPVRFRLLAATHRDLAAEIDAGHFRLDLYYRIAVTASPSCSCRSRPCASARATSRCSPAHSPPASSRSRASCAGRSVGRCSTCWSLIRGPATSASCAMPWRARSRCRTMAWSASTACGPRCAPRPRWPPRHPRRRRCRRTRRRRSARPSPPTPATSRNRPAAWASRKARYISRCGAIASPAKARAPRGISG